MSEMIFIPISELAVGDAVVETDGYLLAVISIEREGSMVIARLANDFSPVRAWRSPAAREGDGVFLRRRADVKIGVIRGGGGLAVPSANQAPS